MNPLTNPNAPAWFNALLVLSLQAALLTATVWLTLKAIGRWIPPNWRALLWFIVVARVLIPIAPPSPLSLQNIFLSATPKSSSQNAKVKIDSNVQNTFTPTTSPADQNSSANLPFDSTQPSPDTTPLHPAKILAIVWLIGAAFSLAILLARALTIRQRILRHSSSPARELLDLLDACRAELRLTFPITVTQSNQIAAPALTGLLPARLIVPTNFSAGEFTRDQIRHILLHELAHIKQGHLLFHWLALIARALQWFNPAIHFAASQLRHECELAADAAALKHANAEQRTAYGNTILQVLEFTTSRRTGLALGMANQTRHLEQRLRGLKGLHHSYSRLAGILVFSTLTTVGLSGAMGKIADAAQQPRSKANVRYAIRVAQFAPEKVSDVLSRLAIDPAFVVPVKDSGFTNLVIPPDVSAKLGAIKEMQGLDFLEIPPRQAAIGVPAQFQLIEEPELSTNLPANTAFGTSIKLSALHFSDKSVHLDCHLFVSTFVGYSTDATTTDANHKSPTFRVHESAVTNEIPLGGSLMFYVPPTERAPASVIPTLGRLFRAEPVRIAKVASLVFVTPTISSDAGPRNAPTVNSAQEPASPKTSSFQQPAQSANSVDAATSTQGRQNVRRKLDTLRLESYPVADVDLIEVLKDLSFKARNLDPNHTGINFIISSSGATDQSADADRFKVTINPPVRDITLGQLCEIIVTVAKPPASAPVGARLQYSVEDYGVVFRQSLFESQLATRSFRVDPSNFRQGLQAIAAKSGVPPNAPLADQVRTVFSAALGSDLPTNTVAAGKAPPPTFEQSQQKRAIFFNDQTGVLFVRAPQSELDIIENAVHAINRLPTQVSISIERYELPDAIVATLTNRFPAPSLITATNEFLLITADKAETNAPALSASKPIVEALSQPIISRHIQRPATQFVLDQMLADQIRQELKKTKGVDAQTGPNVTTLVGRQARISIEETFTLANSDGSNAKEIPIGWSFDCWPESFDGKSLQMTVQPVHARDAAFQNTPSLAEPRSLVTVVTATSAKIKIAPGSTLAILLPAEKLADVPDLFTTVPAREISKLGKTSQYLVFITPWIVDAAGNRIFPAK